MDVNQFFCIAELLPEPMMMVSLDSTIVAANQVAVKVFGLQSPAFAEQRLTDLSSSPPTQITQFLRRCTGITQMTPCTMRLRDAQDSKITLRCEGVGVREKGNIAISQILLRFSLKDSACNSFVALNQKIEQLHKEILERKKIEEALQESEERARLLLDSTAEAIFGLDLQGNCTFCNSACLKMLGYESPEELLEKNMHNLIHHFHAHGEPSPLSECPLNVAFLKGQGTHIENEVFWRKDGSSFATEYWSFPMRKNDAIVGSVVTFLDITERRNAAQELQEYAEVVNANNMAIQEYAEAAEAASRAKTDFLASMSHELRTPLNAVIGFSEGMLDRANSDPLSDHQKNRLTKIHSSGQHLLSLINDVLDIAKVEAGSMSADVSTFRLRPLTEEISALAEGLLRKKPRLKFHLKFDGEDIEITSDRAKVKQIIINLISNAIKFTDQGSVTLHTERRHGDVCLRVEDTGMGIPESELHMVFGKFFQVREATNDSIKGTGLGLSICKTFAEMLGGTLTLRSQVGQGSSFALVIPITYEPKGYIKKEDLIKRMHDECFSKP